MIIRKVYEVRSTKQLLVSVPKGANIKDGDYVEIKKIRENGDLPEAQSPTINKGKQNMIESYNATNKTKEIIEKRNNEILFLWLWILIMIIAIILYFIKFN